MEDDWDSVAGSDASDVVCASDSAHDRGCLILVVDAFSAEVCGASLAHLKYNGGLLVAGGFERCNDLEAVQRNEEGGEAWKLTVLLEVTLMAGIAKLCFWQYLTVPY